MALLEDDELDFDDAHVQRSDTNQPLFEGDPELFKLKETKKDKKLRGDEKRGTGRSLPWGKSKELSIDKTPKKSKHSRNKSASRTPPDSPKTDEVKKLAKGGVPPNQPSPNVKGNRKSYSQLDDASDDNEDDRSQEEGLTVLNHPALDQEGPSPPPPASATNPWASSIEDESSSPPKLPEPPLANPWLDMPHTDPWHASPSRRHTTQFPVLFGDTRPVSPDRGRGSVPNNQLFGDIALSPDRHGRGSLPGTQLFMGFPSPVLESRPLTSYQPVTALPPPPQPFAPPPSQMSSGTTQSLPDPDWSISDELLDKCVSQFKELSSSSGFLQGDKAREFFVQSKLPNQELSTIWRLADVNKDNALSQQEFCVAMKLVMMRRKGYEIPSSLPQALLSVLLPRTFSDNFGDRGEPSPPPADRDTPVDNELNSEDSTGVLVVLSSDTGESEGGDEDMVLVDTHKRTGSEGAIPKKPARPAPPVPKVQRSKTVKGLSSGSRAETSSPTGDVEGILITIDQGSPQKPRKSNKKSDYAPLDSSESTPTDLATEDSTDGHFGWKQLDGNGKSELEPPDSASRRRGHHRGGSLDLSKVIQADHSKDVLEDLPSAVPPKLPPRPHQSPPLEQFQATAAQSEEDEGGERKSGRIRSLSTGSITKHTSPEHQGAELETNVLIKDKPKSTRKVRMPPRRPPPPAKPSKREKSQVAAAGKVNPPVSQVAGKADLREYQVPGDKAGKDKKELQSTIRSLKDQNALLTEFNKTLEAQLFKLMEERVKLEQKLELLS